MPPPLHIVTGALGYSGQYIAKRLLAKGCRVRTLTNSPQRENPLHSQIEVHPFNFENPAALTESLRGAEVLYNTYWVRFNHKNFTFKEAVKNTQTLFAAAQAAGIHRIIHVSITNPDPSNQPSELEYFAGKGVLEKSLQDSGLSHAILRPTVLFGMEDILVNNIAWILRHFPIFAVPGSGDYKLQPIFVDDLAAIAVDQAARSDNVIINCAGPEEFTYRLLILSIGAIIDKPRPILLLPPSLVYGLSKLLNPFLHDILITRDEIRGLMQNRLYVKTPPPPLATTKLTQWAATNKTWLGAHYASELARRENRVKAYV